MSVILTVESNFNREHIRLGVFGNNTSDSIVGYLFTLNINSSSRVSKSNSDVIAVIVWADKVLSFDVSGLIVRAFHWSI